MKNRLLFLAASVMAALAMSVAALAGGWGSGGTPPPTDGGSKNKGAATVKYQAAYNDNFYGPIQCTGVHLTGKNFGTFGKDSFTCVSTTGSPLRGVFPGELITLATTNGWYSDYYFFTESPGSVVVATELAGIVSDDGFSVSVAALY
jgi:hypothetical protein